ncbi:MAG: hypothetical protein MI923_24810 [Phycisphaerales bacterium]|nr:hypothetical protein [Phycisphaerales bacterium]
MHHVARRRKPPPLQQVPYRACQHPLIFPTHIIARRSTKTRPSYLQCSSAPFGVRFDVIDPSCLNCLRPWLLNGWKLLNGSGRVV